MLSKLPKIKLSTYGIIFIVLCAISLIGYSQAAIRVHFSLLDATDSIELGLTTALGNSGNPLDILGMGDLDLNGYDLDESLLSEILSEIGLLEHFEYVRGQTVLSAASYLLVVLLIVIIAAFTFLDKFKPAKLAVSAAALALFFMAGTIILNVQEMLFNLLNSAMEDYIDVLMDFSDYIYLELAAGYWITLLALAGMLLTEAAIFFKGRFGK
ncbi:MAG: hypothetical protein FWB99_05600 [Treponema sp.]|nr:hypothetical protein [Treponema sp.]